MPTQDLSGAVHRNHNHLKRYLSTVLPTKTAELQNNRAASPNSTKSKGVKCHPRNRTRNCFKERHNWATRFFKKWVGHGCLVHFRDELLREPTATTRRGRVGLRVRLGVEWRRRALYKQKGRRGSFFLHPSHIPSSQLAATSSSIQQFRSLCHRRARRESHLAAIFARAFLQRRWARGASRWCSTTAPPPPTPRRRARSP